MTKEELLALARDYERLLDDILLEPDTPTKKQWQKYKSLKNELLDLENRYYLGDDYRATKTNRRLRRKTDTNPYV